MKLINPHTLSAREWNRLASLAGTPGRRGGLKAEDWGEAWLELKMVADKKGGLISEQTAIGVLRYHAVKAQAERARSQNCEQAA